jgi:DNA topoisomerase-1
MAAAQFNNTAVDTEAKNSKSYLLRTNAQVNIFPGFTILYSESKDEAEEELKSTLPDLKKGDSLNLKKILPLQHFTQPPSRYTEATLVKALEQAGIGRPSTYAPTISTIQEREYVERAKGSFRPTELGFIVTDLLTQYFPIIMNIKFTATMENKLDSIADGGINWTHIVGEFYKPFNKDLEKAMQTAEKIKLEDEQTGEACPKCGKPLVIKSGRFGKFVACSGYPECRHTQSFQMKLGVKCPQCGGEIVQRKSKQKRTFYGCNNYPECQFISNQRPLPEPCPKCGSMLTYYRGKQAKCTKCDYIGKQKQDG